MTAEQLGRRTVHADAIRGGETVQDAAKIFVDILHGKGTWAQNAVVLANAAMALHCTGSFKNYGDAYQAAVESLESGKAKRSLEQLISMQ
jgi:anthranilate phosphoribosyltransferase